MEQNIINKKSNFQKITFIISVLLILLLIFQSYNNFYIQKKEISKLNKSISKMKDILNIKNESQKSLFDIINNLDSGDKKTLHDPSFEETYNLIVEDETDKNEYNETNYNCVYYSRDTNNNIEKKGIRCAYVEINTNGPTPHAIIGFQTTDKGLVFFEPQTDKNVTLRIGKDYWTECLEDGQDHGPGWIIKSVYLYW